MLYASQLLGKKVYQDNKVYGKLIDMAIVENRPNPPVSKIEIKHNKKKVTISPLALSLKNGRLTITTQHIPQLPYDHKDFYLGEDLLDKQVIDTDGKRLVRVNDVLLETDENGKFLVAGIDVGFDGVLRRLGLPFSMHKKILPWTTVEALDYDTGAVRLNVKEPALSTLHPSEIANILEDAGTKERVGIVSSLPANQAARAIEEADDETQVSILESVTPAIFKNIINKMHISEIADVFNELTPERAKELQDALGVERSGTIKRLSYFSDNVAGGLMREHFLSVKGNITIKELQKVFLELPNIPESIVITNDSEKLVGILQTKDILRFDTLARLSDIVTEKKFVYPQTSLREILRLFSQYNLRALPVIDKNKKPIGLLVIDDLLALIEEEKENNENI
ncbi:MAG TPA: CBS domain-containing protein [Patescibacteria group bacterium]|nr:CBS domain-containing protein [Patescibacteria group bacterium]